MIFLFIFNQKAHLCSGAHCVPCDKCLRNGEMRLWCRSLVHSFPGVLSWSGSRHPASNLNITLTSCHMSQSASVTIPAGQVSWCQQCRSGEPLHSVCTDSDSDNTDLLSEAGLAKSQSIEIQYLTRENDADTFDNTVILQGKLKKMVGKNKRKLTIPSRKSINR